VSVKPWNELLNTWFSQGDKDAIEWAIGCIIAGGPKKILVITGDAGTGKSITVDLMARVIRHCREESTNQVVIRHDGLDEIKDDSFMIVADNVPLKHHTEQTIGITTTGKRIPHDACLKLFGQAYASPGRIGSQCLTKYRNLGKSYFEKENDR
jgi:energy-coupling factor transporter ATP-binding protein EcfA2